MLSIAVKTIETGPYAKFGRYLHPQHFAGVMGLALLLHVLGVVVLSLMPAPQVVEVPVRVMNVKLGGDVGGESGGITSSDINRLFAKRRLAKTPEAPAAAPVPAPTEPKANELARGALETVKKPDANTKLKTESKTEPAQPRVSAQPVAKPARPKPKPKAAPAVKQDEQTPKRYVRESQTTSAGQDAAKATSGRGSILGNSTSGSADARVRYTQTVSLWIDKHKIYPEAARTRGEGGKVILRIRINRQGRIVRFMLEKSSGSEAIDRAITQMIDAANPLPAVPAEYPDKKDHLEFLIPINFIP